MTMACFGSALLLLLAGASQAAVWGSPRVDPETAPERLAYVTSNSLSGAETWVKNPLLMGDAKDSKRTKVGDFEYFTNQNSVRRFWPIEQKKKFEDYQKKYLMKLVRQNILEVISSGRCSAPSRRCLSLNQNTGSGAGKTFTPNCAMVHRCAHDSGCCESPGEVCAPVETEDIYLYFLAIEPKKASRVEELKFNNHTRCDCVPLKATPIESTCLCPKDFSPVPSSADCKCDCDKRNSKTCRRIKKGKRSYPSRACKGDCGPPVCDFGAFKSDFGRCTRRNEIRRAS